MRTKYGTRVVMYLLACRLLTKKYWQVETFSRECNWLPQFPQDDRRVSIGKVSERHIQQLDAHTVREIKTNGKKENIMSIR